MGTQNTALKYKAKYAARKKASSEFSEWSRKELIEHILELRKKLAEGGKEANPKEGPSGKIETSKGLVYNKNWNVATKIHFVLHKAQRPLNTSEILSQLQKLDVSFRDYTNPPHFIASYLSRLVKIQRFNKIKPKGLNVHFYFLPEWLDEQGQLKDAYKFSFDYFKRVD